GLDRVAQALGVAGHPGQVNGDAVLLRWRLWSVLLALPLPWLACWTAVRVAGSRRAGLVAATATLGVPQLSHLVGAINNDGLLFTVAGVTTLAAAWIATGDRSRGVAVVAGASAGVAMLVKVFGLG